MLEGKYGQGTSRSMELLTKVGDTYGAEKMVPIRSAHFAAQWGNFEDDGLEWLRKYIIEDGARCHPSVFFSHNPLDFDYELRKEMGVPDWMVEKDDEFVKIIDTFGVLPFNSCQPYMIGNMPYFGEHLAWAASGSQNVVNSMFGARNERISDHEAFAAAATGRYPEYGLHLKENRAAQIIIKTKDLDYTQFKVVDYAALACYVGKMVQSKIPVFVDLPQKLPIHHLLSLSYPLTLLGPVAMFHLVGATPEAPTLEAALQGKKPEDTITVGPEHIKWAYDFVTTAKEEKVDVVAFGCPHCPLHEIREIAGALEGKRIHKDVKFWVSTSKQTKIVAQRAGLDRIIREAGGYIIADTCLCALPAWAKTVGVRTIATASIKWAFYAHNVFGLETYFGSCEDCIKAAVNGKWSK